MLDIRETWKAQIELCKKIADDIIKNNGSAEACSHAAKYAGIDAPFPFKGRMEDSCGNYIRVNYGEAYAYVELDKDSHPTGIVHWNNDEMGIPYPENSGYESSLHSLNIMSSKDAFLACPDPDYYDVACDYQKL